MIIVVMGVSGSGKTTIGKMLADAIRCSFLEGDSLHSKENIEKMSHGIPLTDSDRAPWLTAIRTHILKFFKRGENLVVGCSALEQQYREFFAEGSDHLGLSEGLGGTHSSAHETSAEPLHEGGHASQPV